MRLHLMGELDIARIHIGRGVDKSEQWTAMMRGRIKCLEGIIALGDDRPVTGK